MSGFGAKAYARVGLDTDIVAADPHRLILMLFDGAIHCIERAKFFLGQKKIAQKCEALSQACRIVDAGLRVSVDPTPDPEFAGRLVSLYQYILMRLLQGNLRNDVAALDEAARLLGDLRSAWIQIAPRAADAAAPESDEAAVTRRAPVRREIAAYQV
jgi:flagellar protein FliS